MSKLLKWDGAGYASNRIRHISEEEWTVTYNMGEFHNLSNE